MGKVMTVLKIFPAEGTQIEQLLEKVKAISGCNTAKIQPYVYGMQIIQASFICEDAAGVDFEEIVRATDGVDGVQVDEVGLIG